MSDDTTALITLALARWHALHGEVTAEDYRLIVTAAHEVNSVTSPEVTTP